MRLLELVSRWLFSSSHRPSRLHHPHLYELDIDRIAQELDLRGAAKKLAEARLPSPDQTVITAPEAKAVQRIEKARQDFVEWATFRLGIINEGLRRRSVTALVNRALEADKAFHNKARAQLEQSETLLQELAAHAQVQQRELDEFRARHNLARPAKYPEGTATFARYALLLALVVCEAGANAYFFSQGLDSGLVGGFIGAGFFAAVNLVIAFVIGKFGIPLIFHRERTSAVIGGLAVACAITSMAAMGLTIGHFRDALIIAAAEPSRLAWITLQSSPFALRDINSWLLFAISILFALFALFDGLLSDDPYPGYGRLTRRAHSSRQEYLDELEAVRRDIEELKAQQLASLDYDIHQARSVIAELQSLIGDKESARNRLATALLDAENCLAALIKMFRDENEIYRNGLRRPPYFDLRPSLQALASPDFRIQESNVALREQQQRVERLIGGVEYLRSAIHAACDHFAATLKPHDCLASFTGRPRETQ